MTTVIDALMQAAQDLRDATSSVLGLRADMQALKDSTTNNATTIIQNFTNRAPSQQYYIDFNNGVDAPGRGLTIDTPFKTIDYALDNRDISVNAGMFLMTDQTMRKYHALFNSVGFQGIVRQAGDYGLPWQPAPRKISLLPEADNSPAIGLGRFIPRFDVVSASLRFNNIDIALPTPASGVTGNTFLTLFGTGVTFASSTITVESAASLARLIGAVDGARSDIYFGGVTFGPNMPGKIFGGIAAGSNPNASFSYNTNITSA